jgi:DNA-binding NarL/FixJ family response regulator
MAIVALGLVRDLFFRSKLDAVAASLGAEILYASDLTNASRRAGEKKPSVVFADLSDAAFPAADTAEKIREAAPDAKLIGFASHVDLKPLRAAREAGFDQTLSRSEFTARLAEFLQHQARDPES